MPAGASVTAAYSKARLEDACRRLPKIATISTVVPACVARPTDAVARIVRAPSSEDPLHDSLHYAPGLSPKRPKRNLRQPDDTNCCNEVADGTVVDVENPPSSSLRRVRRFARSGQWESSMIMFAIVLLALPAGATGSDASDRQFKACLASGEAAQGVDSAMKACASDELSRRDTTLNAAYRVKMSTLGPAARERLRLEERAWIRTRDAQCRPRMGPDTGSLGGLDYLDCMIGQTVARTRSFKSLGRHAR